MKVRFILLFLLMCFIFEFAYSGYYKIDGYVRGKYYPKDVYDNPVNYTDYGGVKGLNVTWTDIYGAYLETQTNSSGYYCIEWYGSSNYGELEISGTVHMENSIASTHNDVNKSVTRNFTPSSYNRFDFYWATDGTNVFYHFNKANDYFTDSDIGFPGLDQQEQAYVLQGSGTGYEIYSGYISKYGNQTSVAWAKDCDIITMVYSSQLRYKYYNSYYITDYSTNQALGMYYACSQHNDPRYASSCYYWDHRLDFNHTMDDYNNPNPYAALYVWNGQILGGGILDIKAKLGQTKSDKLTYDAISEGEAENFSDYVDYILYADDDDGNIGNGTPNIDDILIAFYNHGIYPNNPSVPPLTPQNFSSSWSNNHPCISWTANTEPDLKHYEIWKKRGADSWNLRTTTTLTYYIDNSEFRWTKPKLPSTVYYKVCAVDNGDQKSGFTSEESFGINAPQ
jgi:hypothetical protein